MFVRRMLLLTLVQVSVTLTTGSPSGAHWQSDPPRATARTGDLSVGTSWLGREIDITSNVVGDERRPAVVYNRHQGEYLVAYELESGGIMASPVLLNGLVGWYTISSSSETLHPSVAFNGRQDQYLVVWQQYNTGQSKWEIWGRIIPGAFPDPSLVPFLIAEASGMSLTQPVVAWNSYRNEYMVVWQSEDMSGQLLGIARRRVGADGSLTSGAGWVRQAGYPGSPDIAYNPASDEYMVVWAQLGNYYIDIYGVRLNWQGGLQGNIFPVSQASDEQQLPAIATNEQNRFLVVWQDHRWGDWDIYAQLLDVSGSPVGGEWWVAASVEEDTQPDVAANGAANEFLVVWQQTSGSGEAIFAARFDAAGSWLDWFEVAAGGFGDNGHPAVATHLAGYFVTYDWESWEPGATRDVYGRMWSPHAVLLPMVVRYP